MFGDHLASDPAASREDQHGAELPELTSVGSRRRPPEWAWPALIIAGFTLLCLFIFGDIGAADLMAVWLAGEALATGQPDLVYPVHDGLFTMEPPHQWWDWAAAHGQPNMAYPYIYPPLWAVLAAPLTGKIQFQTVSAAFDGLNALMLCATLLLARRIAAPQSSPALYLAVGLVLLMITTVGSIAVFQTQPQILVAFLTVLAVERLESGRDRVAGAVLALAAAIKLYPVLFALLWLAMRRFGAVASFALVGGALGLSSVLLAGWPLHRTFLDVIDAITDTVLLTSINFSVEGLIAQLLYPDAFTIVSAVPFDPARADDGWRVMLKPDGFALAMRLAQLAVFILLSVVFMRVHRATTRALLWPFVFGLVALFGSISWSYHYIAMAAFLPAVASRLPWPAATAAIAGFGFGASVFLGEVLVPLSFLPDPMQAMGTLTMVASAALFAAMAAVASRT